MQLQKRKEGKMPAKHQSKSDNLQLIPGSVQAGVHSDRLRTVPHLCHFVQLEDYIRQR